MDRSEQLTLISRTYTKNAYGVPVPSETERTVFVNVSSVTASEFFEGGRNGLNPEYRFTMFRPDYNGETICEYKGNRYAVYRTFLRRTDTLEVYVQREGGTNG